MCSCERYTRCCVITWYYSCNYTTSHNYTAFGDYALWSRYNYPVRNYTDLTAGIKHEQSNYRLPWQLYVTMTTQWIFSSKTIRQLCVSACNSLNKDDGTSRGETRGSCCDIIITWLVSISTASLLLSCYGDALITVCIVCLWRHKG